MPSRHTTARAAFLSVCSLTSAAFAQSSGPPESVAPVSSASPAPPAEAPGTLLRIVVPGEWQLRMAALSDLPLATTPGRLDPATLGQNLYVETWFRFRPEISIGRSFRIVSHFDVARGILFGDTTQQVDLSRDRRTTNPAFPNGAFDLRWLYAEWTSPIGLFRIGQQGSHWGLGIVANDGNHRSLFGDYRMGDLFERIAYALRPAGRQSDVVVAIAGDLVYRDRLAQLTQTTVTINRGTDPAQTYTLGGDRVLQGVLSAYYQDHACTTDCDRKRIGVYATYRDWTRGSTEWLRAWVADVSARWEWLTPDGSARVFAGGEFAMILGSTNMLRTTERAEHALVQFGGAVEFGIYREQGDHPFRVTLAGGYASGDSNPLDATQRRFTFNPDHRVGLILFPEVMAWQTARSATIAVDPGLLGRTTRGAELLPTSGGVANAMYFNPTAQLFVTPRIDVRAGMVLAATSTDWVDPVQVTAYGNANGNYRGGSARSRDLGVEFDLGLMGNQPLGGGLTLTGGAQGGVLLPGHALDDAAGRPMPTIWVARLLAGLSY